MLRMMPSSCISRSSEAEDLAKSANLGAYGRELFVELDADVRRAGDLVDDRRDTTARCIAQAARARRRAQQHFDQLVQRRAVALDRRVELHVATRAEDRRAMQIASVLINRLQQ